MRATEIQLLVGDKVTYTAAQPTNHQEPREHGSVVATPVFDRYTTTWWVPVRPDGAAADTEPDWVSGRRIVEVESVP
ncbi:hypothetical protein BAY61_15925 [Prauserella marina]|uniref:Uncharacterized protein n=1 Tax=Prauserella marina TaxID=530584 RepID=A0A222VQQ0_9PSEU|nr:hypothetical protein [Prauserella marina]ASR36245.1 hypothetical protein BAY61_15925 [Prauserella marina]PWV77014.1 hypothetical protein DES30_105231 [Prauserella marina]SDD02406.1 hypothetical protein SAMN05421630_105232 [Prauserella marina]